MREILLISSLMPYDVIFEFYFSYQREHEVQHVSIRMQSYSLHSDKRILFENEMKLTYKSRQKNFERDRVGGVDFGKVGQMGTGQNRSNLSAITVMQMRMLVIKTYTTTMPKITQLAENESLNDGDLENVQLISLDHERPENAQDDKEA